MYSVVGKSDLATLFDFRRFANSLSFWKKNVFISGNMVHYMFSRFSMVACFTFRYMISRFSMVSCFTFRYMISRFSTSVQ